MNGLRTMGTKERSRLTAKDERLWMNEAPYRDEGRLVAGMDEAGRGPLAGPVCAACVILPPGEAIPGLRDSKKLSAKRRQDLAAEIRRKAQAYCIAFASVEEVDRLNILGATMLAMKRAIEGMPVRPDLVLVDGDKVPDWPGELRAVIGGDDLMPSIAAASILAKVQRDHIMTLIAAEEPRYGFETHKGYGTKMHYQALDAYGESLYHRKSFLRRWKK